MTHYRIVESRCTDGKSTFYVESKGDHWWSWWSRVQVWRYMDTDDAQFDTLEKAQSFVKGCQVTCETIIHPIS